MKFCPKCGAVNINSATQCSCGEDLSMVISENAAYIDNVVRGIRDDVKKALAESGISELKIKLLVGKRNVEEAQSSLFHNECIVSAFITSLIVSNANSLLREEYSGTVIFLTNQRIVFYCRQSALKNFSDGIYFDEISSVNFRGSIGSRIGYMQIHTNVKTYDIAISSQNIFAQKVKKAIESYKSNTNDNNVNNSTVKAQGLDVFEQLEKLSVLKEKGIISEDEFKNKKAELLSKI